MESEDRLRTIEAEIRVLVANWLAREQILAPGETIELEGAIVHGSAVEVQIKDKTERRSARHRVELGNPDAETWTKIFSIAWSERHRLVLEMLRVNGNEGVSFAEVAAKIECAHWGQAIQEASINWRLKRSGLDLRLLSFTGPKGEATRFRLFRME